jgi:hypothetical protein
MDLPQVVADPKRRTGKTVKKVPQLLFQLPFQGAVQGGERLIQ